MKHALLDEVGHLAQRDELVADHLALLVEGHAGAVALGHLEVAGALRLRGVHRADHRAEALAEVLEAGADHEAAVRERALRAPVDDLEEELAHRGVDRVADEVRVERLENRLADENLRGHCGGVGHARAADRLDEGFLDHAVLDVQRELAGSLLRRTPAHAVRVAADVLYLLCLHPLPLFGNRRRTVVAPLHERALMLNFSRVDHVCLLVL